MTWVEVERHGRGAMVTVKAMQDMKQSSQAQVHHNMVTSTHGSAAGDRELESTRRVEWRDDGHQRHCQASAVQGRGAAGRKVERQVDRATSRFHSAGHGLDVICRNPNDYHDKDAIKEELEHVDQEVIDFGNRFHAPCSVALKGPARHLVQSCGRQRARGEALAHDKIRTETPGTPSVFVEICHWQRAVEVSG